jgi:hypothetical protein
MSINAMVAGAEQKLGLVTKSSMYKGQWGFISGEDASGEVYITPVTTSGQASMGTNRLMPIQYVPPTIDDEYTYTLDTTAIPSGTRVIAYTNFAVIEDDYVYTRQGASHFTGASNGDLMYLSASGFLTCTMTATGVAGYGTTPVAQFVKLNGTNVVYRILNTFSGTTTLVA